MADTVVWEFPGYAFHPDPGLAPVRVETPAELDALLKESSNWRNTPWTDEEREELAKRPTKEPESSQESRSRR